MGGDYLIFRLEDTRFVIPSEKVILVSFLPEVTETPVKREYVLGLIYMVERISLLLDLKYFLWGKKSDLLWDSVVITLNLDDSLFSIVVDDVERILKGSEVLQEIEAKLYGVVGRWVEKVIRSGDGDFFYINLDGLFKEVKEDLSGEVEFYH